MNTDKQYAEALSSQLNSIYSGIGSAQEGQALKPPQPALGNLHEATKYLHDTAANVRKLADHLCGTQPESVGSKEGPTGASFFAQLDDIATDLRAISARIGGDIARIQNRL